MLDKENLHVFNYIKKEEYCASTEGMRYMLKKKETENGIRLEAIIWPEPYCCAKTPEEKKQRRDFSFSPEGLEDSIDWMNRQLADQKQLWELSKTVKL